MVIAVRLNDVFFGSYCSALVETLEYLFPMVGLKMQRAAVIGAGARRTAQYS
jgi:hypothetical protein